MLREAMRRRDLSPKSADRGLVDVHIRWMLRRDMPEVLAIERTEFEFPWSEDDFVRSLRQTCCIGMVAEWDNHAVAYMVYELYRTRICLLNLCVMRPMQRRGIGRAMMDKLKAKLSLQRRRRIAVDVREKNLDAHLFFRQMGFRAEEILRGRFDNGEDAYRFEYQYGKTRD
ncbi:MAG: GNAT family N-acetyltransferase [Patescibacteria group bacterium]|jgi:ribosomal-protein-alanine N-acetyltransferase